MTCFITVKRTDVNRRSIERSCYINRNIYPFLGICVELYIPLVINHTVLRNLKGKFRISCKVIRRIDAIVKHFIDLMLHHGHAISCDEHPVNPISVRSFNHWRRIIQSGFQAVFGEKLHRFGIRVSVHIPCNNDGDIVIFLQESHQQANFLITIFISADIQMGVQVEKLFSGRFILQKRPSVSSIVRHSGQL